MRDRAHDAAVLRARPAVKAVWFSVPALPKSVNVTMRAHFTIRTRERDEWTLLIRQAMRAHRIAPVRGAYTLRVTFFVPTRRRWDASNHLKNILDALVRAGCVEDDGAPLLVMESYATRLDCENPRTEFTIEPAAAPAWEPKPLGRKRA